MRELFEKIVREEELILLGVVSLACDEDYQHYEKWISEAKHADLAYLVNNADIRKSPNKLLPGAQCAVVIALPYFQNILSDGSQVAQYALFPDYHKILQKKGRNIVRRFQKDTGVEHSWRVVVDTAPLLERALAAKTFSGFIGKNTCYIHPQHGSFLLLAEILTTFPFSLDEKKAEKGCESCTLCQVACPTGALSEDYKIDTGKCLSYWTIENRGPIPEKYWPYLAEYWYGCDICQTACPYNAEAVKNTLPSSIERKKMPSLYETATMDQTLYEKYFGGTPMTRAKRDGLRRNALIAMAVTNDQRLSEAVSIAQKDSTELIQTTVNQISLHLANTRP